MRDKIGTSIQSTLSTIKPIDDSHTDAAALQKGYEDRRTRSTATLAGEHVAENIGEWGKYAYKKGEDVAVATYESARDLGHKADAWIQGHKPSNEPSSPSEPSNTGPSKEVMERLKKANSQTQVG